MEKISGIIASTPRLSSVDMKDAAPVRPGTPSFGRPQGVSSLAKSSLMVSPETAKISGALQEERADWRTADAKKASAAAEVSNAFFMKNNKEAEPVHDIEPVRLIPVDEMPARMSQPAGFKTESIGRMKAGVTPVASFDEGFDNEPELEQPEGLYPKGSFIDRTA